MKLRFFKAMAITGIMALSSLSALPMATSAVSDPNRDGVINISDVVTIQSYLNGTANYSDLYDLDFNDDIIVDIRDMVACQRYCTGIAY